MTSATMPFPPVDQNTEPIGVVHVGLGPIGRQILAFLGDRKRYRSVGAVDIDPDLVGKDLADVAEAAVSPGQVRVVDTVSGLGSATPGAVAVHCAGSSLEKVAPTFMALLEAGYHTVSTCEELSNPWATQPQLAADLDACARRNGVVLLGTGVNPGYSMDYLPVVLAASQRAVRGVQVHRVQDAGLRRLPLQRKVGAGLTTDEFADRVAQGTIRHVGLPESARIIDRALDLGCTGYEETIDPVIADSAVPLGAGTIEPGRVLGIDQLVVASRDGEPVIRLHLQMAVGLADPRDVVTIDGDPGLESVIRGLHGDSATAAVVVNSLGRVQVARPGLRTVDEIPASPINL
ncbi:NAD(P)H-dependent amine dehydrogenase family protein [Phytoactinopolyspora halotolerans]|uniref:Dihydrodipicolinate reductase n=1 Tax=Phytoactinopolyspora halotolerans TaxID=1981512 RepID=A0A6L9SEK4_9ACTN|nr:dihydrodipicolinate reductase [Phytoactinopolyspora halotolerans]NEE03018.1 dihydrodipicolinate reductase [Phytoactinopolyspora halotolerans]